MLIATVPEPSAWAMIILGFAGVGYPFNLEPPSPGDANFIETDRKPGNVVLPELLSIVKFIVSAEDTTRLETFLRPKMGLKPLRR